MAAQTSALRWSSSKPCRSLPSFNRSFNPWATWNRHASSSEWLRWRVRTRSVRTSLFDPSPICAGVVAVLLLVIGGITLARAGVDSSLDKPVVNVAGFTATALLGVFEVAFGILLLIAALSRARAAIMFFSIVGVIVGLIGVFQPTVGNGSLALERGFAVIVTIAMLVVLISTVFPTVRRTSSVVETV